MAETVWAARVNCQTRFWEDRVGMDVGEATWVERTMQEGFRWAAGVVGEMRGGIVGVEYYDAQTWKKLDSILVEHGEKMELGRFNNMDVHVPR